MKLPLKHDLDDELSRDIAIFDSVVLAMPPCDYYGGGHVESGSTYVLDQAVNAQGDDRCWRQQLKTARSWVDSGRRRP